MTEFTDEHLLQLEVELGVHAKKFLESDLGLAVISRQQTEIKDLQLKLEDLAQTREQDTAVKLEIRARRRAIEWLLEIINQADLAYENLELSNAED